MDYLLNYDWPGNVRELENTVERLVLFSRGAEIDARDLPPQFHGAPTGLDDRLFAGLPPLDARTMSAVDEIYNRLIKPHVHQRW